MIDILFVIELCYCRIMFGLYTFASALLTHKIKSNFISIEIEVKTCSNLCTYIDMLF